MCLPIGVFACVRARRAEECERLCVRERVGVREPRVETAKSARYTGVMSKVKPRTLRGFTLHNVGITVLLAVSGLQG